MKPRSNLQLIYTKKRGTQFDEFAGQPWYVRWFVIGATLALWAIIFNFLLFGWLYL